MPLTAHLEELRHRIIISLVAVAVAFAACYAYAPLLFELLLAPLRAVAAPSTEIIGTGVAEAFFTQLKVAVIAAIFIASPVILYETWQFVAPGLYASEKRYVGPFVVFGTLFFALGGWFCYEVVFTFGFRFFLGEYARIEVAPNLRIGEYLSFASRLILAFGITFEMPLVTFFLARIGLVTHRELLRFGRYAVVGVFALAAILTPPDVVSQVLLAGPLLVLYGVSIGVAYVFGRKPLGDSETTP